MKVVVYDHLQEDIQHIREEVFMKEQGFENEFDDLDAISTFVVIYDDQAMATGRFYPSGDSYVIGRVAVLKPYRNQGLGKLVIQSLEEEIQRINGKYIELSAQQRVQSFYENLGYTRVGDVYYDEHCPHVKMIKEV